VALYKANVKLRDRIFPEGCADFNNHLLKERNNEQETTGKTQVIKSYYWGIKFWSEILMENELLKDLGKM
jgi:hypothetical protein